ncbi:hypothetical protein WME79_31670 [Sorangium sp. So ce726]|uniref:hypothetical protein n=1 Tax=Sorangium sp. So ce726 TaxID=3133319 RepID=UPI003F5DD19D
MRSLHRLFCFCLVFPAGLSCGFPDATFTERSSVGAGGASGATESASTVSASSGAAGPGGGAEASSAGGHGDGSTGAGAGGDGSTGSGGGAAGSGGGSATSSASAGPATSGSGGGSTTSSTSASAATSGSGGGSATSSTSAGSTSAGPATSSSGGGTVDCDADDDGYLSIACEGGDDCNDDNPSVHPNQPSTFYDAPFSPGRSFDYDCSGVEETEFASVKCSGLLVCAAKSNVFLSDVPCGGRGPFGSCDLTCQSTITFPNYVRECH